MKARTLLANPWIRRLAPVLALAGGGGLVAYVNLTQPIQPAATTPAQSIEQPLDAEPSGLAEASVPVAPTAAEGAPQSVSNPTVEFAALAAPAPPSLPRRDRTTSYEVQAGDKLWEIAERFGLRTETLAWANALRNADLILIGQKLRVPTVDGLFYTTKPGDALANIAFRFGLEAGAILTANSIADADQLMADSELFLPGARPLAAATLVATGPAEEATMEAAAVDLVGLPENLDGVLSAGWLRTASDAILYRDPGRNARALHTLPASVRLERAGGLDGRRVMVRDPGDGRTRQAMTGWVDVGNLEPGFAPSPRELPRAYPEDTRMDIAHVFVPYRTQLDGSAWAAANCGPTALSMLLASFGTDASPGQLRREVLAAQGMFGNYIGTLLTALAKVGEHYGIRALDLYEGGRIKRWTLDDIRAHLHAGRPVIVQVFFRRLPGYESIAYYADHYIVVTGVLDDAFLYNDPLNSDGPGWDRVISGERLSRAMDSSDKRFQYAAFAAAPGG